MANVFNQISWNIEKYLQQNVSGELDAWMNDEVYVPKKKSNKPNREEPTMMNQEERREDEEMGKNLQEKFEPCMYLTNEQILGMLAAESNQLVKRQSARERARKASREIMKERNDTSGGGVVSEYSVSYRFSSQLRY